MKIAKKWDFGYRWVGLGLALLIITIVLGWSAVVQGDSMTPDWLNNQPQVVGRYRVASDNYCYGSTINMKISGLSQKLPVCVLSGEIGGTFFGSWQMPNGAWLYGFGLPGSDYMYTASSCRGVCDYSFSTDTLLTIFYSNGQANLLVSQNAMAKGSPVNINGQHSFNTSNDQSFLTNSLQTPVIINQFNVSKGGRYIALSLQSGGEAIVDLAKMTIRQVLNYNPVGNRLGTYEAVSVSDDGRFLSVVSQENDELVFIDTLGCGTGEMSIDSFSPPYLPGWCQTRQYSLRDLTNDSGVTGVVSTKWANGDWQGLVMGGDDGGTPYLVTLKSSNQPVISADYLALGDSFTSGEGETSDSFYLPNTNINSDKCHISSRSYPFVAGMSLGLSTHSVACSGATTADILGGSSYLGQGKRASNEVNLSAMKTDALANFKPGLIGQVEFVADYHPGLVSVGIGGNDVGMFAKLRACLMPDECEWASTEGLAKMFQEINRKSDQLATTYRAIKGQSPASRLFVVGYPEIISESGDCGVLGGLLDEQERQMMNKAIDHLDYVIAQASSSAGAKFIDIRHAFAGHRLCEDGKAMNAFRLGDDSAPISQLDWVKILGNETFHPTPYGHELIATIVARAISSDQASPIETEPVDEPTESDSIDLPVTISKDFSDTVTVSVDRSEITATLGSYNFTPASLVKVSFDGEESSSLIADDTGGLEAEIKLPTKQTGFIEVALSGQNLDGVGVEYHQTIGVVGQDTAPEISSAVEPTSPALVHSDTDKHTSQSSQGGSIDQTGGGFVDLVRAVLKQESSTAQTVENNSSPAVLGESSGDQSVARTHDPSVVAIVATGGAILVIVIICLILLL